MATSPEEILEGAATDGSIDVSQWKIVLETVLRKLHHNVSTKFPRPRPIGDLSFVPIPPESCDTSSSHSFSIAKDDGSSTAINGDGVPPHPQQVRDQSSGDLQLPPEVVSLYVTCTGTLRKRFSMSPPYTIQRLAELTLRPNKHYRFLPPYLAALDQVLSVSSPVTDFPMPQLHVPPNSTFLSNGEPTTSSSTEQQGQESDESLGGALLTPIPWLKRENTLAHASQQRRQSLHNSAELPTPQSDAITTDRNAAVTIFGAIPAEPAQPQLAQDDRPAMSTEQTLRAEGAVTQGELLRQEQEAGVVPVAQAQRRQNGVNSAAKTSGNAGEVSATAESHERLQQSIEAGERGESHLHPHARGPAVIGMEDMGPQDGGLDSGRPLDIEGAVGRSRSKSPQPPELPVEQQGFGVDDHGSGTTSEGEQPVKTGQTPGASAPTGTMSGDELMPDAS